MDTHQQIELEQIEQDMQRLIGEAEQAAESVRSTLSAAIEARDKIIEQAERDGEQIRVAARRDGDEIRAEAHADGGKIRAAANEDADSVVQETRDRAAQMLQTAQAQADRILDEARELQISIRAAIPGIQGFLDEMGPALAKFASASEAAHIAVADAIDELQPAATGTDVVQKDSPAEPGNPY